MHRTMSKGISFASVHHANLHRIANGCDWDTQRMAWVRGDLLKRDASSCLLMQAGSGDWPDSTRAGADQTENRAALRKSSKYTGAIAAGAVVQRSR